MCRSNLKSCFALNLSARNLTDTFRREPDFLPLKPLRPQYLVKGNLEVSNNFLQCRYQELPLKEFSIIPVLADIEFSRVCGRDIN